MEGRTQELRQDLYGCVSATSTGVGFISRGGIFRMYNQMEGRTQELRQGLYGCVSATSTGATKATGNQ